MKKYLVSIFVILMILIFQFSVFAAPKIQFESNEYNFKKIFEGEKVKAVFKYKNVGDENLIISDITVTCGCTDAKFDKSTLKPNETGEVSAIFDSKGFRNEVSKSIVLYTNDLTNPEARLVIKGEVIPIAKLEPERFTAPDLITGQKLRYSVKITPNKPEGFKIKDLKIFGNTISDTKISQIDKKKNIWEVSFTINAGDSPRRIIESIYFITNLPDDLEIRYPIYANVVKGQ
ncbi:MAG: DUF1573 domain-containing protein [Armatimonadota bacterium]